MSRLLRHSIKYKAKICRRQRKKGLRIYILPIPHFVWECYPEGYQEKWKDLSRAMMVKFGLQRVDFGGSSEARFKGRQKWRQG